MSILQKTSLPPEDPRHDYDTDSPPYSPSPSEMERPSLHPQLSHDLRKACAILVAMTDPPDPDDDQPDPPETIRKIAGVRKADSGTQVRTVEVRSIKADLRRVMQQEELSPREEQKLKKEQPGRYSTRRPRQDSDEVDKKSSQQRYLPKDPMGRSRPLEAQRKPSDNPRTVIPEPVLPPVHAPIVERALLDKQAESQALGHIRSSLHMRPKTSAAACIDYEADHTAYSSKSTSRSTSDYAAIYGRPTSTGVTSVQALTPNIDGGRPSQKDRRPSEGESYSSSMKEEMQELARRRADEYVARNGQRPPSRTSKLSRMTSQSDLRNGRPGSRAGSLASSIAGGISNYIRPRSSSTNLDGGRSGRASSLGLSRSESRSSSRSRRSSFSGAGGWWRNGGLRRRGSWASFRSGGGNGDGRERNRLKKNGEPNLNRPLPALPGLDQYKETKTHIGQLVKNSAKKKIKKSKIGVPQPLLPPDTPYTATIPQQSPRSRSNLGQHAASAPLPDPDGPEIKFPQSAEEQPGSPESRNPHPESYPSPSKSQGKLRRSSLNPAKPRRDSATADASAAQAKRMPPPIIRGPSYKKELEVGIYPRRMEVNDGTCHVNLYEQQKKQNLSAMADKEAGEWERRGGLKGRMGKMLSSKQDGRRAVAAM